VGLDPEQRIGYYGMSFTESSNANRCLGEQTTLGRVLHNDKTKDGVSI